MDDILAKKNRHLFLEEKDNVGNSFIANVNTIVDDLDNIDAVANDLERIDTVADNINNVNTVAENIDDINTTVENLDKIDQFNDNLIGLLESLLEQLGEDGNAWLVRLTELGESILATTSAFNYAVATTLTQDIASGATLTLPEAMKYRVGTHMLMVFWNGTVCYIGDQYNEVGNFGQWSTTITMNVPLKTGDKIQFRVVALADATAFVGQIDSVIGNTSVVATGSTENRTLADRFADIINVKDFGAKGDGVTDDTDAFTALEAVVSGRFVNLGGNTYAVDSIPDGNFYYNGYFFVNGIEKEVLNGLLYVSEGELIGAGTNPSNLIYCGTLPNGLNLSNHNNIISFGIGNLKNIDSTQRAGSCIAIGEGVMSEGHPSNFNIGIGIFALHNVNGVYSSSGDRNTAVGSLSLFGLTTGRGNVGIGRDTGQCITTGSNNVAVGYQALCGRAPVGLSGDIECQNALTGSYNTAIGFSTAPGLSGASEKNTIVGGNAGLTMKIGVNNTVIGFESLRHIQINTTDFGKEMIYNPISGTYSQSETTITVTASEHDAVVGQHVSITFTSGEIYDYIGAQAQTLVVLTVSGDNFTVSSGKSMTASGNCTVNWVETSTDSSETCDDNVFVGIRAGYRVNSAITSTVLGAYACHMSSTESGNTLTGTDVLGALTAQEATSISYSQIIGYSACRTMTTVSSSFVAGRYACGEGTLESSVVIGPYACNGQSTSVSQSVCIGPNAGRNGTSLVECVFIGENAGDATTAATLTHCTAVGAMALYEVADETENSSAIGYGAQVTGSNQVQLGNSSTTTYAYGSVQDRSDVRDKADIRDTILGLDFLCSLHPVDFKWDYRDDYFDYVEKEVKTVDAKGENIVETVIEAVPIKKDGSRKRNRYHHGLIAQEVKAILDEKGIDFGGYQDHSINGGKDILTLGYEEFIAPMIKAIQELNTQLQISNAKIEALMQRISALENNQ